MFFCVNVNLLIYHIISLLYYRSNPSFLLSTHSVKNKSIICYQTGESVATEQRHLPCLSLRECLQWDRFISVCMSTHLAVYSKLCVLMWWKYMPLYLVPLSVCLCTCACASMTGWRGLCLCMCVSKSESNREREREEKHDLHLAKLIVWAWNCLTSPQSSSAQNHTIGCFQLQPDNSTGITQGEEG